MRYLLDTCVLAEFVKPRPAKRVVAWLDSVDIDRQYISALILGEIRHGISRLPALVTRNVSDFRHVDIGPLNPWENQAIS